MGQKSKGITNHERWEHIEAEAAVVDSKKFQESAGQ